MAHTTDLFRLASEQYGELGVSVQDALDRLRTIPLSLHAWQGDDVTGFENTGHARTGGCQVTGNYPGRARNADELRQDLDQTLALLPGDTYRVCLQGHEIDHASPGLDRDAYTLEQFSGWLDWAADRHLGLDIAPAYYSHPKLDAGLSLAHPDPAIRQFWVDHGKACRRIGAAFGRRLGTPAVCNVWVPDGFKDIPADRTAPRQRLLQSLDLTFAETFPETELLDAVESKLFGIGVESYTVNSHEFVMQYAMKQKILALLDMGHFHLTESVADKISSFLLAFGKVAFHISRPVRWDSDHVIRQNDDLRACAQEIVKMGPENFIVALDYFDASICRVAAWVLGMRNMQKELLKAMLTPWKELKALQDAGEFTAQLVLQEEYKNYPADEVWTEFCKRNGVVADESWLKTVQKYEKDVLLKR